MDMSSMTMASATKTMSMAMSTSAGMSMATTTAMAMDMGAGACKISMTWNWYVIDACFIAKSWRITSEGMFAGSCIGVILLTMSIEFLRRCQREYDAYCYRQDTRRQPARADSTGSPSSASEQNVKAPGGFANIISTRLAGNSGRALPGRSVMLVRQVVRSLIHMVAFAVAYFVMLLAMYYNGYIIICIIIGAFLGNFAFSWDQMTEKCQSDADATAVTNCCG